MMKYVFGILILLSLLAGALNGRMSDLSGAVLSESASAVTLCISLAGMICLWGGLMRIAQSAGLTELIAKAVSPLLQKIFKGLDSRGRAMQMILLNLTANLLGLANASTPFGLEAMRALKEEENTNDTASDNMILFVVMNTASLQILPTTIAALRQKHGSQSPMEILPLVWAVSLCGVTATVTVAKLLSRRRARTGVPLMAKGGAR